VLKFADKPTEQASRANALLRMYHADMCTCGRTVERCREVKIARAIRAIKKKSSIAEPYAYPDQIRKWIEDHPCPEPFSGSGK